VKAGRFAFVPDVALGLGYLTAWVLPGLVGAAAVGWLVLGIELEALALLGAYLIAMALVVMLDPTAKPLHRVTGAGIIVALIGFAAVQVIRHQFWWPAVALAALLSNRVAGVVTAGLANEDARMQMLVDALMALGLYVFTIGPTFYLPVPGWSATVGPLPPEHARWCAVPGDFVADFFDQPVSGDWCAQPHRALAGGALYFLASGLRDSWRARRRSRR
jgi:hypothetical protein